MMVGGILENTYFGKFFGTFKNGDLVPCECACYGSGQATQAGSRDDNTELYRAHYLSLCSVISEEVFRSYEPM